MVYLLVFYEVFMNHRVPLRPAQVLLAIVMCFVAQFSMASGNEIRVVLISDLNDAYGSTSYSPQVATALSFIASLSPHLVLCAGDMVAGQSNKIPDSKFPLMWNSFKTEILTRVNSSGAPFAFAFGNHDGAGQRFIHERNAAIEFWRQNRPELKYIDASGFPEYYSFELAELFFAIFDASSAQLKKDQADWLQKQLSGSIARQSRIRVVMGHLPLYAVAEGRNKAGDVISNADDFFQLLEKHGVNYYISGHHHAFFPSRKGNVRLISAGCLGGGPRRLVGSTQRPFKALTLLSLFPEDNEFKMQTYDMTSQPEEIVIKDLPASITGFNGISYRYP